MTTRAPDRAGSPPAALRARRLPNYPPGPRSRQRPGNWPGGPWRNLSVTQNRHRVDVLARTRWPSAAVPPIVPPLARPRAARPSRAGPRSPHPIAIERTPMPDLPAGHPRLAPGADPADVARLLHDDITALPRDAAGQPITPPGWWRTMQQRKPHLFAPSALTMTPAEFSSALRTMRASDRARAEERAAAAHLAKIAARQARAPHRKGNSR
jgi:hypothetical protein